MYWAEDKFRTVMNREAFTDFSDEATAYFFGLLLADGNVAKDRARIKITLKVDDIDILHKLREYLCCTNEVKTFSRYGGEYAILTFSSKEVKDRLAIQNLLPCKSTQEKLPNFDWLSNRHFWRGMVDGDGSLFYNGEGQRLCLLGSKEIVDGFNLFAQEVANCSLKNIHAHTTSKMVNYVNFSGFDAKKIAEVLYKDSNFHLDRNKILADKFSTYVRKNTGTGKAGVTFCKTKKKYLAKISINKKVHSLGSFTNFEDAVAAREAAELKYFGRLKGN